MNRSLKLSMLMALALGSTQAMALELGQIQVKSALGQPLLAEIPLHPATPAELQNLSVQLASGEDFARAGIAGGRTSIPLHFSVVRAGSGQAVIRITSSEAVDDPYLDLLLEVNGRAGKSVREFAVLLDPPSAPGEAPAMAAAPAAAPVAPQMTPLRPSRQVVAATPRPGHAALATHAASSNGKYGPVQRGQNLSTIARDTAPPGVDVHQMLLALKQANPDAFYRDNINALKSGAVLRVPDQAEAQAMAVAAAMAEVRRQNSDWRAGAVGKPATVADAATRPNAPVSPAASGDAGDRLALVPAKEGAGSAAGGGTASARGQSVAAVRQDLLRTQESLASLQQQSTDLKTRLKDLTDINGKNEHLLSLKDSEIAALQAELAAARKAAGSSAKPSGGTPAVADTVAKASGTTPTITSSPVVAPSMAATSATAPAAGSSAPVVTASAAAVMPARPASTSNNTAAAVPATGPAVTSKPATAPVRHAVPSPVTVIGQPWYMQPWAWAVAAGAVVVLLLLALLGRRRRTVIAPARTALPPSLADRFGSAPGDGGSDADQDELLDQLAEHPDDIGLHLELVTLYYSRRDVERFEAAAEAMHAHVTDPQQDEWQDVLHMGEDLAPGHPLFDHHAPLPLHEESEARRAFDIDDYAADDDTAVTASTPPLPPQAPKKVSEYNYDFDLTAAGANASLATHETPQPPIDAHDEAPPSKAERDWQFDASHAAPVAGAGQTLGEFSDDPVDTKLDLARAYLDMGDAEGARGMLGEVLSEGSQVQQDAARKLLETLH